MPELFHVLPPEKALEVLLSHLPAKVRAQRVETADALDRVLAERLIAEESLPAFSRSTMDGYAVRAADTYGAGETLPAYLTLVGEVRMGSAPHLEIGTSQAAVVHTGGMLPPGADAVVMIERTQRMDEKSIEVLRAVAPGENVIQIGEDIREGEVLLDPGCRLYPRFKAHDDIAAIAITF